MTYIDILGALFLALLVLAIGHFIVDGILRIGDIDE